MPHNQHRASRWTHPTAHTSLWLALAAGVAHTATGSWSHRMTTERNGLRRRKRRIACHRWVCWWAWSPILELQTREQLSHGQALRLLRGRTPLPNCSLMFQSFDSRIFKLGDCFVAQSSPGWAILSVITQNDNRQTETGGHSVESLID